MPKTCSPEVLLISGIKYRGTDLITLAGRISEQAVAGEVSPFTLLDLQRTVCELVDVLNAFKTARPGLVREAQSRARTLKTVMTKVVKSNAAVVL